jgi:hypothetical protein
MAHPLALSSVEGCRNMGAHGFDKLTTSGFMSNLFLHNP